MIILLITFWGRRRFDGRISFIIDPESERFDSYNMTMKNDIIVPVDMCQANFSEQLYAYCWACSDYMPRMERVWLWNGIQKFLRRLFFTQEATFYLSARTKHMVQLWEVTKSPMPRMNRNVTLYYWAGMRKIFISLFLSPPFIQDVLDWCVLSEILESELIGHVTSQLGDSCFRFDSLWKFHNCRRKDDPIDKFLESPRSLSQMTQFHGIK